MVSNIVVISNQHIGNIDFGFYKVGQIGDFVWLDTNGNGIQDDKETGISGVTILLNGLGGDGNSYQFTTQTDANGVYSFTDLYPGNYELTINIPTDHVLSKANQGTNRTKDADFDASGKANITLINGQNGAEIDAGFYKYGNIGDFVWHDLNANGKQDVNEPGLSAIDIMLEGNTNTGEPMLLFTTTDTDGKYFFNNLAPGVYSIKVTLPSGYELTIAKVGNTDTDSDFQNLTSTNIMILSGSNVANIDAGLSSISSGEISMIR